tara:strand:+ start:9504 stop:10127 length:624 start_codon:yes stop_codon:yes gene_type:complete
MKILVACEASQAVCLAFREVGHEAYSADTEDCYGGHPEWHIKGDVLDILDDEWDMMIAHPPCTHLAVSGAAWFAEKIQDGRQQEGIDFFMKLAEANIPKICVENPICIMSTEWREPDQIIQPYYFGDDAKKTTCLWLKGLNPLVHIASDDMFDESTHVEPSITTLSTGAKFSTWEYLISMDHKNRAKLRSKTFPGIAKAMAQQWGAK